MPTTVTKKLCQPIRPLPRANDSTVKLVYFKFTLVRILWRQKCHSMFRWLCMDFASGHQDNQKTTNRFETER